MESILLFAVLFPTKGLLRGVWSTAPSAACACVAAPYDSGGPCNLMFSVNSNKLPVVDERVGESGILLLAVRRGRLVDDDRPWFGCMIFFRRKER